MGAEREGKKSLEGLRRANVNEFTGKREVSKTSQGKKRRRLKGGFGKKGVPGRRGPL